MHLDPDRTEEDAIVLAFFARYRSDLEELGAPRELAEYVSCFPGYEALIEREYAALRSAERDLSRVSLPSAASPGRELLDGSLRTARYRPLGELARGGMGVIVRVRDERLRRDLAMKSLARPTHSSGAAGSDSRLLSRFLDEALITGQLGHPGIVPVHDLGVDEDGRAFFTMSLIAGRSFAEIISEVHAGDATWTMERALGVLVRVCEAVSFAHSRGVIHRDLKPQNVMIGAFGETYVLDWGLARVAGAEHAPDIRPLEVAGEDATADSPLRTRDGDVLGTPAYMAPEQARGEMERLSERSDVYALGAMLYHLLAGSAPFAASEGPRRSSREVLARVRSGPPPALASFGNAMAPELVAICERAMQRAPQQRYESVAALGEDLRAFLELRVVKAYKTGAWAELRQWVRRNRALAATAAAAVLALVAGLALTLQQRSRARAQADSASSSYELARDSVDRMLTRVGQHRLTSVPQMEELRLELLREALAMHERLLDRRREDPEARADVARSLLRVSKIQQELGDYREGRRAAEQALERLSELHREHPESADLSRDLAQAHSDLATALLQSGETAACAAAYDAGLRLIEETLRDAPENLELLGIQMSMRNDRANLKTDAGDWAGAVGARREVATLAARRLEAVPQDADAIHFASQAEMNLGLTLANVEELDEAESWLLRALAHTEPISPAHEREPRRRYAAAMVQNRLSWVQFRRGRRDEARASLEAAILELRALVRDYPQTPGFRIELGSSLFNLANVAKKLRDGAAEEAALEESAREQALALSQAPNDATSAQYTLQSRLALCRLLLERGRAEEAARRIQEFADAATAPIPALDAARLDLRCAASVEGDLGLDEAQQRQLAERCTHDAVRRLAVAARFDPALWESAEFAELAQREDFQELRRAASKH